MQHTKVDDPRSIDHDPCSIQVSNANDFIYYIEVLVRNWRLIAKTTMVAFFLTIIISLCLPNFFNATAKILPPQQDSSGLMGILMGASGGMGGVAADLLGKGTSADMYVGILNSDDIRDRIIERFNLMEVYDQKYRLSAYKVLDKNVNFSIGKKDGIINISVYDKDPKRAANIANAYVDELGKLTATLNITDAEQNRTFFEGRLVKAREELTKAENAIKVFQSRYKALDINEQVKGTIKGVADLEAQLAVEEVKLAGLQQSLTNSSQEVISQYAIISNIKAQISKLEGNRTGVSLPGVGSVPELGQQYLRLMREFKIQEAIVELLTKQNEMAKLSAARDSTSFQIIQVAKVPDRKAKPKRALLVLMGTFVAFFFSITYAFLLEYIGALPDEEKKRLLALKSQLQLPNAKIFCK